MKTSALTLIDKGRVYQILLPESPAFIAYSSGVGGRSVTYLKGREAARENVSVFSSFQSSFFLVKKVSGTNNNKKKYVLVRSPTAVIINPIPISHQ